MRSSAGLSKRERSSVLLTGPDTPADDGIVPYQVCELLIVCRVALLHTGVVTVCSSKWLQCHMDVKPRGVQVQEVV